jgi:hypothetical protein
MKERRKAAAVVIAARSDTNEIEWEIKKESASITLVLKPEICSERKFPSQKFEKAKDAIKAENLNSELKSEGEICAFSGAGQH